MSKDYKLLIKLRDIFFNEYLLIKYDEISKEDGFYRIKLRVNSTFKEEVYIHIVEVNEKS